MIKKIIQEACQTGLPQSAIADRLIRICGIDAENARQLIAAFFARKSKRRK